MQLKVTSQYRSKSYRYFLLGLCGGVSLIGIVISITPVFAQESVPVVSPEPSEELGEELDEDTISESDNSPESDELPQPSPDIVDPNGMESASPESDGLLQILSDPNSQDDMEPDRPGFDDYRLGPGDSISVEVQRFSDLSFQATLDLQGNVTVPLEGTLDLTGLTLDEAQETIYDIYNQYVVEPNVSLTLNSHRPVEVTIVGEVPRPGAYALDAPQLSVALVAAGGTTMRGDLRAVQVRRTLSNDEVIEHTVDLFTPLQEGRSLPQVRLQNGDVVAVPPLNLHYLDEYDRNLVAISTMAKPEITVHILNHAAGAGGTEANFGAMTLRNGSRFLDALAQAGVNPDSAAYHRIAVLRFNPETESADTIIVNAREVVNGDLTQNILLQENDVIVVDRNLLTNVTRTLNTITQPFRDVLGFLLFFDSLSETAGSLFSP